MESVLADPLLVAVHLGGVDVPVTDLKGLTDRPGGVLGLDLEDPEAELRDGVAVVKADAGDCAHGYLTPSSLVEGPTAPKTARATLFARCADYRGQKEIAVEPGSGKRPPAARVIRVFCVGQPGARRERTLTETQKVATAALPRARSSRTIRRGPAHADKGRRNVQPQGCELARSAELLSQRIRLKALGPILQRVWSSPRFR
jgi:hypothetical protein